MEILSKERGRVLFRYHPGWPVQVHKVKSANNAEWMCRQRFSTPGAVRLTPGYLSIPPIGGVLAGLAFDLAAAAESRMERDFQAARDRLQFAREVREYEQQRFGHLLP